MRPHGTTQETTIYIFTAVEISKLIYIYILGVKFLFANRSPNEKWSFCVCLHYCVCLCSDYMKYFARYQFTNNHWCNLHIYS